MAIMEVKIPDIGDFDEVAVIELLVKVGDKVRAEQSLITVESDKASMEIPSSHSGVITALMVKLGDKVKQGSVIVKLELGDVAVSVVAVPVAAAAPSEPVATVAAALPAVVVPVAAVAVAAVPVHQPTAVFSSDLPHASPSVRKFARELGVPLNEVKGSGPKGRIGLQDI
ncbi:MAG: E3 binding domain-containing protein, partial [Burkholderiales bacterium]|nr:E3 binding domain-containing protein [Burkholderiales bacterium]